MVWSCWNKDLCRIDIVHVLFIMWLLRQVYSEGRLIVEFNFDDLMRIRSWHFAIRNHRELIPRSVIAMQVNTGLSLVHCHPNTEL